VNGSVGVVVAPQGRLLLALTVTVRDGRIAGYDVIADPVRLRDLDLAVLAEASENYGGRRRGRA
jgi:RNA polymerase sigma-70 factor (ECF subfamily)